MKIQPKPTKADPDQHYSIQQLADMYFVSYGALRKRVDEGKIKAERIVGKYRILGSDFLNYLTKGD